MAGMWSTVFVEPPMAMSTRIAFSIASSVTICRAVRPDSIISMTLEPDLLAILIFRESTA